MVLDFFSIIPNDVVMIFVPAKKYLRMGRKKINCRMSSLQITLNKSISNSLCKVRSLAQHISMIHEDCHHEIKLKIFELKIKKISLFPY